MIAAYWPISALLVSGKLVYCFRFLALCWLACFASCNRLGSHTIRLKYWRIPVLIFKKQTNKQTNKQTKTASEKQWNLFCHLHYCYATQGRNIHYHCFSWNTQLTFIGLTSMCPLINHTYQEPPPCLIIAIFSLRCHQYSQNLQK